MGELSFRQRGADQVAANKRANAAKVDPRQPFSVAFGTISVSLRVCVGRPFYVGPDGVERRSDGEQIIVVLAMSNLAGAAPMRYEGWGNDAGDLSLTARASLSDDLGTRYTRAATSLGLESWVGQVSGSRAVGPGETLADVLVFGPPNPKASKFTLELPRSNWGVSGVLRLDVPAERVANFHGTLKN